MKAFYVYILGSNTGTLYVGVTSDIERRLGEHRAGDTDSFTKKYHVIQLLYLEECGNPSDAIAREKQIKGWRRSKKLDLIRTQNQDFSDLAQT